MSAISVYPQAPRVLLIEDNELDAILFRQTCLEIGYQVDATAKSIGEAKSILREKKFEIILLDFELPDGAGVDLVVQLSRITTTPIVILTGNDDDDLARQCVAIGAQDYLVKTDLDQNDLKKSLDFAIARSTESVLERDLRERVKVDPDLFRWLENGALDGIWYLDLENRNHQWYSDRFKTLFGYSPHGFEDTSKWWLENVHPDDAIAAAKMQAAHLGDSKFPYDLVARYRHRKGHYVWIQCRGFTIHDENDRPIRLLGALTDVTALKRAEITIKRRNAELERTTYILSHDLRKPIRHMVGFAEAFVEDYSDATGIDDDGREMLNDIRRAGHKLEGLLDGITTFARLGEVDTWSNVDLDSAWNDAIDDYKPEIKRLNGTVEVEGSLPMVTGSQSMIYQLFGNLLGNSIKFSRPGIPPRITIRASLASNRVFVEVQDNGIGIPPDMLKEAFLLFRRVGPQAQHTKGTGLGLAVVARIVEAHGGKVAAKLPAEGGTIIRLDLPPADNRR